MPRRDPDKLARARELRATMSPPERALWKILRAHRLEGIKFSRQVECGPYYIDFAARAARLAIELDGESHSARSRFLESQGWRVIRFTNAELAAAADGVARSILLALGRNF